MFIRCLNFPFLINSWLSARIIFIGFVVLTMSAGAQNVDDILTQHFEKVNIEAKSKITSLKYTGKSIQMGKELPFSQVITNSAQNRLDVLFQGDTMTQAFDGKNGWMIAPWLGSKKPIDLTLNEAKTLKDQANIPGDLYEWDTKGFRLEYIDKEKVNDHIVDKLKLTKSEEEISVYLVDRNSKMIQKIISMSEDTIISVTHFKDYRSVNNIMFPFQMDIEYNGNIVSSIRLAKIELDIKIDDTFFTKPVLE